MLSFEGDCLSKIWIYHIYMCIALKNTICDMRIIKLFTWLTNLVLLLLPICYVDCICWCNVWNNDNVLLNFMLSIFFKNLISSYWFFLEKNDGKSGSQAFPWPLWFFKLVFSWDKHQRMHPCIIKSAWGFNVKFEKHLFRSGISLAKKKKYNLQVWY